MADQMPQFMLIDLVRTSQAVLSFALILLPPGYVLGWLLNAFAFRRRNLFTRLAIAIPMSMGICPVVSYLFGQFLPPAVWWFYGLCALAALALLAGDRQALWAPGDLPILLKRNLPFAAIVAGWTVLGAFTLVDLQIGHRLYFPTVTYDYSLRAAFTSAISRTGVPPHNPYFFPGQFFNLRYHYFWFLLCSLSQQIAGPAVTPRQAMVAGTIWCGIGLIAIVTLYLRFFQSKAEAAIVRRALIGLGLLAVTGLDIYPVLMNEWSLHQYLPSVEWWNSDPVMAWMHAVLWVPHHVAGLVTCLMGFLLLWDVWHSRSSGLKGILTAVAAGAMFSSSSGLTIYVTLVFAIFLAIWLAIALLRKQPDMARLVVISGFAALALSIPWLREIFAKGPGATQPAGAAPSLPLYFEVRHLMIFDNILGIAGPGLKANLANLLALPLNYFLELGFFLIVGIVQCREIWRNRRSLPDDQLCAFTMAASSLVVCTFVRSSVIANNDLGWRGMLIAQFILLIWGAEMLSDGLLASGIGSWNISRGKRHCLAATIIFGLAGSAYEIVKVRFYPVQSDVTSTPLYAFLSHDRKLGERTFALRQLYEELKKRTPANAIYQHNPGAIPQDHFHGLYADRQVAAETPSCGVVFGGDPNLCQSRIGDITALFDDPKAFDSAQIDDVCGRLSIDVLVVKDTDKVWQDRESWAWKRTPILANQYGRAYLCGPGAPFYSRR